MNSVDQHVTKARVFQWAVVLGAVILIYGINLFFPRYLWVQDEARYGEVVREMVYNGNYVVPTLDGEFYPDKPPFYFWILAIQSKITGMNSFSFRLVTLFSMLGFGAAFFIFSKHVIGQSRAIWAELILMTSMLFIVGGNIIRMDMLMGMLVLVSLYYFIRAVEERDAWKSLRGHAFAVLAMGVKGPLGFAFPLLGAMVYGFVQDRWEGIKRLRILWGLVVALVVVGFWAGYLYVSGHRAYLEDIFVRQLLGRSVKSWSHAEPFYFYAMVMAPLLMPWLPFVWRGFRNSPRRIRIIALCWFLPGFLLLSIISGKLFIYLIPIFPAAALLVGAGLPAPWEAQTIAAKWEGLVSGIFFVLFGSGASYALLTVLPQERFHLAVVAIVPVLVGLVMIILAIKRRREPLLWCFVLAGCLISWVCMGWGASQMSDYLSTRKLALAMAQVSRLGYRPIAVDIARGTISFYADMTIRNVSHHQLSEVLDEPGLVAVAIRNKRLHRIHKEDLARLELKEKFPKIQFTGYSLYLEKRR